MTHDDFIASPDSASAYEQHAHEFLKIRDKSAIGLLFLLPETEQELVIKRISDIVNPGGRFLFTALK